MDIPLEIERIDIEREPALFKRYAIRVPVLAIDDDELEVGGIDEGAIVRWLTSRR
jgi:hypothetical protein